MYRKYILRSHLYLYYFVLQKINKDKKIYFVEDGVELHVKVMTVNARYKKKHNILSASYSVNSSDLRPIKDVWNYEKNSLNEYNLGINGVSEEAKERVKLIIIEE